MNIFGIEGLNNKDKMLVLEKEMEKFSISFDSELCDSVTEDSGTNVLSTALFEKQESKYPLFIHLACQKRRKMVISEKNKAFVSNYSPFFFYFFGFIKVIIFKISISGLP